MKGACSLSYLCIMGRGREPKGGHGTQLEHMVETTEGQNSGGKGQGRSGVDNGEIEKYKTACLRL